MKCGILAATVGALMFALTAQAVTVSGDVFLSGQTNHAGTKIMFRAASPSARTDSATSNSSGHYQQALQAGVYDVEFSSDDYAAFTLEDQLLLFDTTLETQQLMPPLSGNLRGIIGPGDFDVVDTIRVVMVDTLLIAAGARLYFRCGIPIDVYGVLEALGTETDSIRFTRRIPNCQWAGIGFRQPFAVANHVEFAVIEYATRAAGGDFNPGNYPQFAFDHCAIRNNERGLYFYNGTVSISQSVIVSNDDYALYAYASAHEITDCVFENNGYGVVCNDDPNCHIARCRFVNNSRGIKLYSGTMEDCFVREAEYDECAIRIAEAAVLRRCTIIGGISYDGAGASISSCIVALSRNYNEHGIEFNETGAHVEYSCFFDNFYGDYSGQIPVGMGFVAFTNANGDSCDTYYNIFLDPMFADTAAGDYHLTAGSPCIDAGDPSLPRDPDGTVADMGAFYFDQLPVREDGHNILCPYNLAQNYPNPFNAQTRIAFDLPQPGNVMLSVFDITGRLVATPLAGYVNAGAHDVTFDARDLPSGVYVYRLTAGDAADAKKMMVIK